MKDQRIENFISKVAQWTSKNHKISSKNIKKLTPSLRKYLYGDFKARNEDLILYIRELINTEKINIFHKETNLFVTNKIYQNIEVGTILPNWSKGLSSSFKNEEIYDYVSWFFRVAEQYLRRAKYIEVMGAISLVYKIPTAFYNGKITWLKYSYTDGVENILSQNDSSKIHMSSTKQILFTKLLSLINGHDHFIHKILFNYIRALELNEAGFLEETITSLDKTVNIAEQIIRERYNINENNQKKVLCQFLNFSKAETNAIIYLYKLRSYFGAHPSASKWWDFTELYSKTQDEFFDVVTKIIIKMIELESKNRIIEKNPNEWDEWFFDNWKMIWDTVWFEKIPSNL